MRYGVLVEVECILCRKSNIVEDYLLFVGIYGCKQNLRSNNDSSSVSGQQSSSSSHRTTVTFVDSYLLNQNQCIQSFFPTQNRPLTALSLPVDEVTSFYAMISALLEKKEQDKETRWRLVTLLKGKTQDTHSHLHAIYFKIYTL